MPSYLLLYGLTSITGIIHLLIGLASLSESLGPILVANGLGYIFMIGAHIMIEYKGMNRRVHHYMLLAYVLATFIAYFIAFPPEDALSNLIGLATKGVELSIMILLVIHIREVEGKQLAKQ